MLAEIPADRIRRCARRLCRRSALGSRRRRSRRSTRRWSPSGSGWSSPRTAALACRGRLVELADPRGGAAGQGTIVVGPAERPERMQWAVAHEIGESVAYRVFAALGVRPTTAPEECPRAGRQSPRQLPALAARLVCRRWTAARLGPVRAQAVAIATASHELIARRMLEMPPPIVVTLCDLGSVRWRRTNAGSRPPQLLPEESTVWRECHESGEPASATLDPATTGLESIHAWPIHEPDWKREILRSAIAEW